jgi:crotonobetainyl-CoA:carnitine CoA-transferase CaiB-like acyl-CoA transferase
MIHAAGPRAREATQGKRMSGALAGIRVLDVTDSIAGQFCTRMLADFGAEVLLIEPPDGAALRTAPLLFRHLNTGKCSVTLDRATSSGMQTLLRLAADAEVIVTDTARDRPLLQAANPDGVFAAVTGFGSDGPLRHWQGSEMIYQALGGLMFASGDAAREPLYGCGDRASYGAGAAAYISILAALFARGRWGFGQSVSVDIAETAAAMANPFVTQFLYNGLVEPRRERRSPLGMLQCRGVWVGFWLHAHLWQGFHEALGLPELAADPRFAQGRARLDHWGDLLAIVQAHVADWAPDELLRRLQERRVVTARAFRLTELRHDCPHLEQRGFWETVATPDGPQTILGPQFRMSATPRRVRGDAPALGRAPAAWQTAPRICASPTAPPAVLRGPLTGLRVVDMTTAWAGPMAARVLAYLGAEVIHVESATRLDSWRQHNAVFNRHRYPGDGAGARPWNRTALFNSQNVNKLSIALELKHPKGHAALLRLLAKSDVLVSNFTAGTLHRMGLGYDRLREQNEKIIVAEMPAFGSSGPMAVGTAIGPSMEMAAGMASMIGYPGGPPTTTGPTYLDPIGALHGAAAILTALLHRQATGRGQHLEVPQVEAAMHYIGEHILHAIATGKDPERNGNRVDWAAPHDAFPAAGNDEWIAIAVTSDAAWRALCAVIGEPALADDSRYVSIEARLRHQDALVETISRWTRGQDKHAAAERLQAAGIIAAPVQNGRDGATSAYLAVRGFFTTLDHADVGPMVHEGMPFHLSRTPGGDYRASPCLGQDTRAILSSIVGLSDAEISELEQAGVTSEVPV